MSGNDASKIKVTVAFCVVPQQKPSLIRQFLAHFQYSVKDNRSKTLDAQTSRSGLQDKIVNHCLLLHCHIVSSSLQSPRYVSYGANYIHYLNWAIGLVDMFFTTTNK